MQKFSGHGLNIVGAGAAATDDKKGGKADASGGSFLTKPLIGPVPGYGVLGILAAVAGGVWYFKFRK